MKSDAQQLRSEEAARHACALTANRSRRTDKELRHELEVHQLELEMQNESLRQAQVALEESRDRFVDFYDFSPVGYLTLTEKGLIADINRTGAALLGVERGKLLQQPFSRFVRPADADRWHSYLASALKHEDRQDCELALQHGEEPVLHVRLDSLRLVTDGQSPTLRIAMTDITEHKATEETLRFHSEILNSLGEGIYLIRRSDGKIVYANPPIERMFGYGSGELLGKHVSIVNAPGVRSPQAMAKEIMAELARKGAWSGEVKNVRKDGTTFWSHANVTAFDHHQLGPVWVSVHQDITLRKRLALELADEQRHLSALIAMSPVGVFETNRDGECIFVNKRWSEIAGLSFEAALGCGWADALHPEDRENVLADWFAAVAERRAFELEYRFQRPDGTISWVFGQSSQYHSATGKVLGYVGTITDITGRKQAEEKLVGSSKPFAQSEKYKVAAQRSLSLTKREREVWALLVEGMHNKEIARRLEISHRTVELHRSRIMKKTGSRSLLDLARVYETSHMPPGGEADARDGTPADISKCRRHSSEASPRSTAPPIVEKEKQRQHEFWPAAK